MPITLLWSLKIAFRVYLKISALTHGCENVTIPIFILTLALRQDILSKNVAVMTPHNHPPIRGVIVVTFFEKMIHCRAREKTNFWRPWRQELWKRQRWIGILVNWGCFLQKYELLLGQYSKISNQWNFLEKDTNFCWIFYLMHTYSMYAMPMSIIFFGTLNICFICIFSSHHHDFHG